MSNHSGAIDKPRRPEASDIQDWSEVETHLGVVKEEVGNNNCDRCAATGHSALKSTISLNLGRLEEHT